MVEDSISRSLPQEMETDACQDAEQEDQASARQQTENTRLSTATTQRAAASTGNRNNHGLPICCHADSSQPNMFRVTRARGKALLSGGFGVTIVVEDDDDGDDSEDSASPSVSGDEHDNYDEQQEDKNYGLRNDDESGEQIISRSDCDDTANNNIDHDMPATRKRRAYDYLFLEEVLFLHEQGMLECRPEKGRPNSNSKHDGGVLNSSGREDEEIVMSAPKLYALLEPFGLTMASYLVFAHLRQQTFRVVRYTSQRLLLLQEYQQCATFKERRALHLKLRRDVQQAPPPAVIHQEPCTAAAAAAATTATTTTTPRLSTMDGNRDDTGDSFSTSFTATELSQHPSFAFCVYHPDSNFSKTNPGLPAFLVAITHYGQQTLSFAVLQCLLQQAQGVPVKLGSVADSGSVVMFGITDVGVPTI